MNNDTIGVDVCRKTISTQLFVGKLYQPFFASARFLGAILSETPMFVAF